MARGLIFLNSLEEFVDRATQSMADLNDIFNRDASLAPFHETDVAGLQANTVAQCLLGPPMCFADLADILTEHKNNLMIC